MPPPSIPVNSPFNQPASEPVGNLRKEMSSNSPAVKQTGGAVPSLNAKEGETTAARAPSPPGAATRMRNVMEGVWARVRRAVGAGGSGDGSPPHERLREDSEEAPSRSLSTDYTELMGGSVPCPSCKGTGRIPKEMEETLVALIPVNDDRLKPKHTARWIFAVVLICLLIASGVIFMLVPRAVELHSLRPSIDHITVWEKQDKPPVLKFHFMNYVNISNANYYSVQVENTTATVISKFQPWSKDQIGTGGNGTLISVSPLNGGSMNSIGFNNSVVLGDVVAEYCTQPWSRLTSLFVNMQFDVIVTLSYFNHREQISMSMVQQVCCVPSGNCTSPN